MNHSSEKPLQLKEGRFARFESIEWWDQQRLKEARVLVVGAGALGNEVLKNLALLGLQNVVVADMDQIEESNLSRSVLFRETDEGKNKAESAAAMMKEICPEVNPFPLVGNILADVGLGYFRWADVVVGALDNREARVFVNAACAQVGKPWVDGGIDVLQGVVRVFYPPETACYECTMSQRDWDLVNLRRSCSLLARHAAAHRGTPTTPTTASVIAGIQTQEVIKMIHGLDTLKGAGFFFDGINHHSYKTSYPINPDCGWHEESPEIENWEEMNSQTPLRLIAEKASKKLGGLDALDLSRELIQKLECASCGHERELWQSIETVTESQAVCEKCEGEMTPAFFHSIGPDSDLLDKTSAEIGLPAWDIIWVRYQDKYMGVELGGDNPFND